MTPNWLSEPVLDSGADLVADRSQRSGSQLGGDVPHDLSQACLASTFIVDLCYHRLMTMIAADQQLHLRALAAFFHSLSDSTRLAIVHRLADGEARVSDLVADLGLAQSTVSAHIGCLKDCGLIDGRPAGRQIFYRLTIPELLHLLGDAETILERTDQAVLDCPIFGVST